jgi:GDP-D-mannose dehydratase
LISDIPDEIYNLAAQSHVRISFDIPQFTVQSNAIGVLNILEAYRRACPTARFYQASSSEMFGNSVDADGFQRETTNMTPVSPYSVLKYLVTTLLGTIEMLTNYMLLTEYYSMSHQEGHLILLPTRSLKQLLRLNMV